MENGGDVSTYFTPQAKVWFVPGDVIHAFSFTENIPALVLQCDREKDISEYAYRRVLVLTSMGMFRRVIFIDEFKKLSA